MDSSRLFAAKIMDTKVFDAFVNVLTCFSKITGDKSLYIAITRLAFTLFVKEDTSNLCKMVVTIPAETFQEFRLSSSVDSQRLIFEITDFKSWLHAIETLRGKSGN
jgi:hypothetical protein